ncbi:protein-tyrosine phosphatase [Psychrobacillus sp. OK028]|uniref:tyrosine-protein phosphatase n=1 Tax=Psychrobacillus sp. OK028 TaxID=1884359 RepID=UPI00088AE547|nr:CpsB/CapC family capsule biosynthesis tyrosine phosphatase [Psychrobacillus sp. OK028]SDO01080.1 protein-tyrosine phosphatase [Psychrobacillus sp. OK028]
MLVDIHNHILPGLDDGPKSIEEALLLAKSAVSNGITHVIATPHHLDAKYRNSSLEVREAVAGLYREFSKRNIHLKILPGQEIHLAANILDELETDLLTLANSGKYLLIELPNAYIPSQTLEVIYIIQLKGYIPIIVHPERNKILRKNKQLLYEYVCKGALIQVTASSLLGLNGRSLRKYTRELIKHNLVHFISSDAHHYLKRPFLLKKAFEYVKKEFSESYVTYFCENASHIVYGTDIQPLSPISFKNYY